jgi:hypothetical protein
LYNNLYPVIYEKDLKLTDYQNYQLAFFLILLVSMYYFIFHAIHWISPSEIFTFLILSAIFNVYMIFRDFVFLNWPYIYFTTAQVANLDGQIVQLKKVPVYWRYAAAWSILISLFMTMVYYFILAKPTFQRIYEEAFSRLNSKRPLWRVYKYYTLLRSLIKLDWVLNVMFILTAQHFAHNDAMSMFDWYILLPYGGFFVLVTVMMVKGVIAIREKDVQVYQWIGIMRILIEVIKLIQCILVLKGINSKLEYSE